MIAFDVSNMPTSIRQAKAELRATAPNFEEQFFEIESVVRAEAADIVQRQATGEAIVPEISYNDIQVGKSLAAQVVTQIRTSGLCIVRCVFPASQVASWNDQLEMLLQRERQNYGTEAAHGDDYFGSSIAANPQLNDIFWSEPQMEARASAKHTAVRTFLNHFWSAKFRSADFDPSQSPAYADRVRFRSPGSEFLSSIHIAGKSVERWLDTGARLVYREIFQRHHEHFDPYDASFRIPESRFASLDNCSMFRSFHGWTALTEQAPGDGVLQFVPIVKSIAYVLLRALQRDVPDEQLCGAAFGEDLSLNSEYHEVLLDALISLPRLKPGDAVFWHPDLPVGFERHHHGERSTNGMYLPATMGCRENLVYFEEQQEALQKGDVPPDFRRK